MPYLYINKVTTIQLKLNMTLVPIFPMLLTTEPIVPHVSAQNKHRAEQNKDRVAKFCLKNKKKY